MDLISSRYRKPKGRPTKRRKMLAENSKKRWQKSSKTVDEKNSNSMVLQRDTLSEPSTYSRVRTSYIFTHKAVFSELLQKVPCKYCTNCTLVIKQHHSMGYSTKMELLCESCHERGHAALETFSSVLNMPTMNRKTFAKCMHNLSVKNKEEIIDVSVSYDGISWQKRGHASNLGLGIIIDILSGLVLDFEVLSKYCHNCVVAGRDMGVDSAEFHIWQKGHADECDKNFDGTSEPWGCTLH
ncbi:uncharacterized protein TNCV_3889111 [Trichonephila clavipes]|nr:uncharacterized protein TNCV_3889111 [Trichonephila clavipes]